MDFTAVTDPIRCPDAFRYESSDALQAQAACLLILGIHLRRDVEAMRARSDEDEIDSDVLPSDDMEQFPVPQVRRGPTRRSASDLQRELLQRFQPRFWETATGDLALSFEQDVFFELAVGFYDNPSPETAMLLMEACLWHPDELVRVAAAASSMPIRREPQRPLAILEQGTLSDQPLVVAVAATALAAVAPEHSRLQALLQPQANPPSGNPSRTCLLVHGTFGQTSAWWQPGGDLHDYIAQNVRSDVYDAPDRFSWSGGWSDAARSLGGYGLYSWIQQKQFAQPATIVAHSHGGNVAMLASQNGAHFDTLALLSCPVHYYKYKPDFSRIFKTVSIRVRLDLAILADGGGQRFKDPAIQEKVLPIWFDHGAVLAPQTWIQYNLGSML
jgi:hypothetical protein